MIHRQTILLIALLIVGCEENPADNGNGANDCEFDYTESGSALDLVGTCDILSDIWGPGSNSMVIGGGLNYSTTPGIGWSQEYGGIYVTSFSIMGENSNYITTDTSTDVKVVGPVNAIIEIWDLEELTVVNSNNFNPGTSVIYTALPNHRYGGFAWYSDNSQANIAINAFFN